MACLYCVYCIYRAACRVLRCSVYSVQNRTLCVWVVCVFLAKTAWVSPRIVVAVDSADRLEPRLGRGLCVTAEAEPDSLITEKVMRTLKASDGFAIRIKEGEPDECRWRSGARKARDDNTLVPRSHKQDIGIRVLSTQRHRHVK